MRYMIHVCPKRMRYVEKYLIPSMTEQGIPTSDIEVWNDADGKGNLMSCMESFQECGKQDGGTWHLQDDVIICSNFAKRTAEYDDGIVCGFCCEHFEGVVGLGGEVNTGQLWYSFQCLRIPNELAGECAEWFFTDASQRRENQYKIILKKYDDTFWHDFLIEKHSEMKGVNLNPNLVDHIDYLIGGSIVNHTRSRTQSRAYYFKDKFLVEQLEQKLKMEEK